MKKGLKYTIFKTDWGFFGLFADEIGLLRTILPMKNQENVKKYLPVGIFESAIEDKQLFMKLQKAIIRYYKGSYADFNKLDFTLSLSGLNDFDKKVLFACKKIPLGQTLTYAQLAKKAGFPKAARPAGNVLAKNPLPLIVPCHRVIRADGKIGRFSAAGVRHGRTASQQGSRTKKKMLELEKRIATKTLRH
jgi:methylated-DNA-[protein]-cysteine S-methyltransferase